MTISRHLFIGMSTLLVCSVSSANPLSKPVLHLNINEEVYIPAPGVRSVSVGNTNIARVKAVDSPSAVILGGVAAGGTTLTLIAAGKRTTRRVVVHGINLAEIVKEIRGMTSGMEGVEVTPLDRDRVRIDGAVYAQRDLDRIKKITEFYSPHILNLVDLDPLYVKDAKMLEIEFNFAEIRNNNGGLWGLDWADGQIVLLGNAQGNITRSNGTIGGNGVGGNNVLGGGGNGETISLNGVSSLPFTLNYLTARGHATIYDTHKILVGDAQEASYEAGGELNVAVAGNVGGNLQTVRFGTLLTVTPRIGRNRTLEVAINAEVSGIDGSLQVGNVPALTTNRLQTKLIMQLGQTVAMSGLVRREDVESIRGVIGLNRIPILGYLFRSNDFNKARSEAVLFITPRVVTRESKRHRALIDRVLNKVSEFQD